jgi:hypothetical protein
MTLLVFEPSASRGSRNPISAISHAAMYKRLCAAQCFICSMTFCTFSVDVVKRENRLQLTFILLLTTVTFKFAVSSSLPRISYLTTLVSKSIELFPNAIRFGASRFLHLTVVHRISLLSDKALCAVRASDSIACISQVCTALHKLFKCNIPHPYTYICVCVWLAVALLSSHYVQQ